MPREEPAVPCVAQAALRAEPESAVLREVSVVLHEEPAVRCEEPVLLRGASGVPQVESRVPAGRVELLAVLPAWLVLAPFRELPDALPGAPVPGAN